VETMLQVPIEYTENLEGIQDVMVGLGLKEQTQVGKFQQTLSPEFEVSTL
jgi:hypothetical protein